MSNNQDHSGANSQLDPIKDLLHRLSDLQSSIGALSADKDNLYPELTQVSRSIEAMLGDQGGSPMFQFPFILSKILANPDMGAVVFGPNGQKLLANPKADQLLGHDHEQSRFETATGGRPLAETDLPWRRALELGEDIDCDLTCQGRLLKTRCQILKQGSDQEIGGVLTFVIDSSEHMQLAQELEGLTQELSSKVDNLAVAAKELEFISTTLDSLKSRDRELAEIFNKTQQ